MTASKRRHMGTSGEQQVRIRWHNQQFFTDKSALGPCGVNSENSLDDENGETTANNKTETNND